MAETAGAMTRRNWFYTLVGGLVGSRVPKPPSLRKTLVPGLVTVVWGDVIETWFFDEHGFTITTRPRPRVQTQPLGYAPRTVLGRKVS